MLENLRFHHDEEKDDPQFSQSLARLANLYVNEQTAIGQRIQPAQIPS